MTRRIESGLHGPTLVLPDAVEDRDRWGGLVIECKVNDDGTLGLEVYRDAN